MKFEILNIITDGFERFLEIRSSEGKSVTVHFLEYREYLEEDEKSKAKSVGDVIEGDLWIDQVSNAYICDKDLMHEQSIAHSSHINAVVMVEEVLDEFSIHARTSICDEIILIEFERRIDFQKGDRVYIEGSLEIIEPVV